MNRASRKDLSDRSECGCFQPIFGHISFKEGKLHMPEQNRTTIIVLSIIAASTVLSLISMVTNTGKSSKAQAVKSVATLKCGSAAGNITDGQTLYSDASCTQSLGTVTGVGTTPGGQKTVFVANPMGKVEQTSRDIVKTWYAKQ